MSEEIKNTPEEIEAVKAEDLEDTVEKENDAEAVIEEISTEEIIAEEPAAEAAAPAPVMKEKKHRLSYERRKGLYGYGFIAIWALGTIYFFILPLIESLIYSFNKTEVTQGGMKMTFIGWKNYVNAFRKDQDYSKALVAMIENTVLRTPLILIFSIFIAVILNQKFKGRTFARSVFFLPVIIATGPVIDIINGNMSTGGYAGGSEQFSSMFEADLVDQLLNFLGIYNISDKLTEVINSLTTDILNLVWNSGIQILIFLSALQTIPPSAKEAASIEGATAWEFFWKITFPYISPMILSNLVYTVIDAFVSTDNEVMKYVLKQSGNWEYGYAAALAWIYFAIVGACLGLICVIINRFVYYEND